MNFRSLTHEAKIDNLNLRAEDGAQSAWSGFRGSMTFDPQPSVC